MYVHKNGWLTKSIKVEGVREPKSVSWLRIKTYEQKLGCNYDSVLNNAEDTGVRRLTPEQEMAIKDMQRTLDELDKQKSRLESQMSIFSGRCYKDAIPVTVDELIAMAEPPEDKSDGCWGGAMGGLLE